MKSAEFGKFPCHITLPNAWEVTKNQLQKKVLSLYEKHKLPLWTAQGICFKMKEPLCHLKVWSN